MPAAGVPRAAADRGEAARRRLAARGHRRVLLHPPRHAARRRPQGRRPPRAHRAHRPHRRARRLRRRDGGDAARAPAASPGMGETTARGFRDKLAMRRRAAAAGHPVSTVRAHAAPSRDIATGCRRCSPPWVLKPRSQAAALGIRSWPPPARSGSALERSATAGRLPARAVHPGRRLPRRLDRLRPRGACSRPRAATRRRRSSSRTTAASS